METLAQEAFASTFAVSIRILFVVIVVSLPFILAKGFWKAWVSYVRADFFAKQKYILLECHLPKGVIKPPLSMEIVISSLFQTGGEGNWYDKYWIGGSRPWFSLEMVSIEGQIHFYIWSRDKFKEMIETQLYSQFPDIEIDEVTKEDYAEQVPYDPEKYQYWGCEFIKALDSHLPIKTYTAYAGMSSSAEKEEGKIDPITPGIEYLGSLGKGEQAWVQICVRAHVKDKPKPGTWFEKVDWKHAAEKDLIKRTKRDLKIDAEKAGNVSITTLTKGEKDAVDAIENNLGKLPFDCGIRVIYVAKKDAFKGSSQAGLVGIMRSYGTPNLNSFKPTMRPGFDYPWQDMSGKKTAKQKKTLFELYQNRSFFMKDSIPPIPGKSFTPPYVMTTEELATIYHFPGQVSRTPTLQRITAKKVEAPNNLPI